MRGNEQSGIKFSFWTLCVGQTRRHTPKTNARTVRNLMTRRSGHRQTFTAVTRYTSVGSRYEPLLTFRALRANKCLICHVYFALRGLMVERLV